MYAHLYALPQMLGKKRRLDKHNQANILTKNISNQKSSTKKYTSKSKLHYTDRINRFKCYTIYQGYLTLKW